MIILYCSDCGNKLDIKQIINEGDIPYCSHCDKLFFPKVNLAIIAILTNDKNQICLVNQNGDSRYKVLIAGYVKPNETLEECVKREIKEEVGIDVNHSHYLNSYFYDSKQVLMVGYNAKTAQTEFHIDPNEIDHVNWYEYDDCLHRIREGSIAYKLVKQFLEHIH